QTTVIGVLTTIYHATALYPILTPSQNDVPGLWIVLCMPNGQCLLPEDEQITVLPDTAWLEIHPTTQTAYTIFSFEGTPHLVSQADVTTLTAQSAIAALGWHISAQQERRIALAPINTHRKMTALAAGLTALIAAGVGTALASWLVRPVQHLTRVARNIIAGDLSVQAEVETRDEIGTLAATFNVMTRRLQQTFNGLEEQIQDLREAHTTLQTREQELQESEIRFRTLSESAILGVYIIQNQRFQYVNPAMSNIFGYTAQELLNMTSSLMLIHPDDRGLVAESLRRRVDGEQETAHYTVRGIRKDGAMINVEILGRRIEHAGRPAVMGNLIDITENKLAEAERMRLATVIEQVGETVIITDSSGSIVYVNPHFETATGYTAKEAIGQNPRLIKSGLHDEDFYRDLWRTITAGCIWQGNIINRRKDGQLYHEATSIFPIRNTEGKIVNYASVKRDITAQVRAAEEREKLSKQIQESAEQIHQIMNTVPEGVLLLDSQRHVVTHNPVADQYLTTLTDGVDSDQTHPLTHLGGRPIEEFLTTPPHGLWHEVSAKRRHFQIAARAVETNPLMEGWVIVLRDVTQEHENQQNIQRQERLAGIGQLAAGIAHDFNNIIAVIMLYSQMSLRQPDLSDKLKERLTIISEQGQRASELINQILDFSRSSILDLRPLDVLPVLKETVRLWQRILPEDIRVELNYQTDTYTINADPTRIQQVLMNLAINARDAMPDGGILSVDLARLRVTNRKSAPLSDLNPGEWVRITVADTGNGIPDDVLPYIFEPFFTTKAPGEGAGLGLAQVYGIMMQHEGHIDVQSQVGAGTVFSLYLPSLHVSHHPDDAVLKETLPLGHGETILVVEDNIATRAALCSSLDMLNYRTVEATNGKEALDLFAELRADIVLVLTDLVMPVMGGKALAHTLYQQDPDLSIIVMSGHPLDPDTDTRIADNVCDWIQKPPSLEHLAETLARVLQA
ncbi:MAG: PAS domain S-box protein, partial [Anaerolineae bacterium]